MVDIRANVGLLSIQGGPQHLDKSDGAGAGFDSLHRSRPRPVTEGRSHLIATAARVSRRRPPRSVPEDLDRVAQCEAATFDDTRVDAKLGMAVELAQLRHRIRISFGRHRIYLGRWAAHDP